MTSMTIRIGSVADIVMSSLNKEKTHATTNSELFKKLDTNNNVLQS